MDRSEYVRENEEEGIDDVVIYPISTIVLVVPAAEAV